MDWYMTDAEILDSWERAIDKKKQVQILADRNVASPREMMYKLIELGATGIDKRWFSHGKGKEPVPKQSEPTQTEPKHVMLIDADRPDLTKEEAYAIADHISITLIDSIRAYTDINSLPWLCNIIHAYEKLCAFSGYGQSCAGGEEV